MEEDLVLESKEASKQRFKQTKRPALRVFFLINQLFDYVATNKTNIFKYFKQLFHHKVDQLLRKPTNPMKLWFHQLEFFETICHF